MKAHILAGEPNAEGVKKPIGLRLENLPKSGTQLITVETLARHQAYCTVADGKITYNTIDGPVVFNIVREPGVYCLTCGERLPDPGGNGTELELMRTKQRVAHVDGHGGKAVRTEKFPAGYVTRPRTFECEIDDQRGK